VTCRVTKLAQGLRVVGEGLSIIAAALLEAEDVGASTTAGPGRFPDDAFIDQSSELVPRNLYLQLARAGAFPSKKHGKKIVAQWRDVRVAIAGADLGPTQANDSQDDLDIHRRNLGLVARSRM
jgi:hypothetical protein